MYEVCMSADSRKVPPVDVNFTDPMDQVHQPQQYDILAFEEDSAGFGSILLKSGMLVLVALSAYGAYHFLSKSMAPTNVSGLKPTYDWSGRPVKSPVEKEFTTLESQSKDVRKIDLTKTASVNKLKQKKSSDQLASILKPVKVQSVVIKPETTAEQISTTSVKTNAQTYTVQPGDTLSSIGRAYKISANKIIEINNIENPRLIKPGMQLFVSR